LRSSFAREYVSTENKARHGNDWLQWREGRRMRGLQTFWLMGCGFLAGFVDSIVGGGGLIQLPALFVFLPPGLAGVAAPILGTNKLASICGTSVAAWHYLREVRVPGRILAPAALSAFVFSFLGARAVSVLNPKLIKPVILVLLVLVATYTAARKKTRQAETKNLRPRFRFSPGWEIPLALALGCSIGFYDGFFGPGTGTFLIIGFVAIFGFDFLCASAGAKVVNLSTNIAALLWFASTGNILYRYAIPLAAANVAGSIIGSRLAILKGSEFVRKFFLVVVLLLISRFAWELATSR
jgi:uncharacterized membrane protein YfcA